MHHFAFAPATITVEQGDTVRWANMEFIEHTATSQTGPGTLIPSGVFDSGPLQFGETFEFTFTQLGDYHYFCIPHGSSMQGLVRVIPPAHPSGDMNCDGSVTVSDIAGFVLALTDPAGYTAQFPGCELNLADINADGLVSVSDIGLFVQLLTGG